jgi:Arc/MetJ family transcription regulator
MVTNLHLDDELVEAAQKLGGHKTRKDAVNRALDQYVAWLRQQAILSDFGTIEYDAKYEYKKQRNAS